jgi:hypothetical protein
MKKILWGDSMDLLNNITTNGSFDSLTTLISIGLSIVLGLIIALVHIKTTNYTKNFIITLTLLPVLVQIVIMLVNGNLGTSVAILGAFSLVRFRSIPGNSREIISVFFAMVVGLAIGTGYLILASILTIIVCLVLIITSKTPFGEVNKLERKLKILIPENLNYIEIFDEVFDKYTKKHQLIKAKTVNMGSIYEVDYYITLKKGINEKEFIDELRVKNGNLKIMISIITNDEQL